MFKGRGCKYKFSEFTKFKNHILRHCKLFECGRLNNDDCEVKFMSFGEIREHLDKDHDVDPLGIRFL